MSGMFESKSDKASRKLARTHKEEKAKRKTRIIAITVITTLLLLSAISITVNSSFIRRTVPVVTIEGVSFTTTEFEYFFNSEYMEYVNMMSQFQGMDVSMPDANRPLASQIHNEDTGATWADVFIDSSLARMSTIVSLYNAAQASGFELSDEQIASIDEDISMLAMQAMFSGFPTTDSFLQQMFGTSMNEREYRAIMQFVSTANFYSEHVRESFVYSPEDITGYYTENRDSLDVFNYRQFLVSINRPDAADFASDEEFNAALLDAVAEARSIAEAIVEGIESEDDFIAAASDFDEMFYAEPESTQRMIQGERLSADLETWLLDETREFGDVEIIDSDAGSNIIFYVSRDNNSYRTLGMRQILISREHVDPEEFPEGEHDIEYSMALVHAEEEARTRAELVHSLFIEAGETEAALIELMGEHSDDTTEGGLYENITVFAYHSSHFNTMKLVPEIEDWLFDESRVVGDSELIYTSDFGYHLIYFTGHGEPFFELIADDRMRTRDHTAWQEGLTLGEPARHFAFILVQM